MWASAKDNDLFRASQEARLEGPVLSHSHLFTLGLSANEDPKNMAFGVPKRCLFAKTKVRQEVEREIPVPTPYVQTLEVVKQAP